MTPTIDYVSRRKKVADSLAQIRLGALLVSSRVNIRYLSGFTGSNAILVLTPAETWIVTDPRYALQAASETSCRTKVVRSALLKAVAGLLRSKRIRTLGFEPSHLTVVEYNELKTQLTGLARLRPVTRVIELLRIIKSPAEVELIRASVALASQSFARAIRRLRPGIPECEVAAEIDCQMLRLGADHPAFPTIVASGPRSALPHARPTGALIKADELLLIDMGAQRQGYASDMTRMVFLRQPSRKVKRLYHAVLDAQMAAIAFVRDGVSPASVDKTARRVLKSHRLDRCFVHSTGHGLGLEVHEPPRIARRRSNSADPPVLRDGMVITIEPGVYIEGLGGIRIEDTVLVTRNGCEVLTPTSKEMLVL